MTTMTAMAQFWSQCHDARFWLDGVGREFTAEYDPVKHASDCSTRTTGGEERCDCLSAVVESAPLASTATVPHEFLVPSVYLPSTDGRAEEVRTPSEAMAWRQGRDALVWGEWVRDDVWKLFDHWEDVDRVVAPIPHEFKGCGWIVPAGLTIRGGEGLLQMTLKEIEEADEVVLETGTATRGKETSVTARCPICHHYKEELVTLVHHLVHVHRTEVQVTICGAEFPVDFVLGRKPRDGEVWGNCPKCGKEAGSFRRVLSCARRHDGRTEVDVSVRGTKLVLPKEWE